MRAVRQRGQGARAPGPQPRQPRRTRNRPARVGGRHGQEAAQDPGGLPPLPRRHPSRAARRHRGVDHWRATCIERCPRGSAGGRAEKELPSRHLAARPTQWKAAWCFFDEGDPAAETWVRAHGLRILQGRASDVAGAIRRKATWAGLAAGRRNGADTCANYLTSKRPYLDYATALERGWPIATGVIEGACRHLVKDRLDRTGARWGPAGAEAILKLRALRSNGDLDDYWAHHLAQERRRVHEARYADGVIPPLDETPSEALHPSSISPRWTRCTPRWWALRPMTPARAACGCSPAAWRWSWRPTACGSTRSRLAGCAPRAPAGRLRAVA